jgi:hypothetical protein
VSAEVITRDSGEDLVIDARELVEVVAPAALAVLQQSILDSVDPSTGRAKPPLGERALAAPRIGGRGVRTGHLANSLTVKITGGATQARAVIAVPDDRRDFVFSEQARGVQYLSTGGRVERAVDAALRGASDGR